MKKMNNKGFMLAETLVVTSFVAGVLIFLFIQFTNLSKNYEDNYKYNTVENLYALEDVRDFIIEKEHNISITLDEMGDKDYIDISNCNIFEDDKDYCAKLFELVNVEQVIVAKNSFDKSNFDSSNRDLVAFAKKINITGKEQFRLIASFKDSTFATLRFGG